MPPRRASQVYEVRTTFEVPVAFAFRWCTDFTAGDAKLEGESYERRILSRTARRVVYEDLEASAEGWHWARHDVALQPPFEWHSTSLGNYREMDLRYRLTPRGPSRTEFRLLARRRPAGLRGKNPAKAAWERSVLTSWRRFAKEMETDYRRSHGRRR